MEPQDEVARDFMARKGFPNIVPVDVQRLDGEPCWYYVYQLPEGTLELEVWYNKQTQEWETMVSTFNIVGA